MWLMGAPFMRNYYVIHDMDTAKISLVKVAKATRERHVLTGYVPLCTPAAEDDETFEKRVTTCSKLAKCYNFELRKYDNGNCDDYHSCSAIKAPTRTLEGCILSKYCGLKQTRFNAREKADYKCPDGVKAPPITE